jgi:hypothetical protein
MGVNSSGSSNMLTEEHWSRAQELFDLGLYVGEEERRALLDGVELLR